jgi:GT2 family glycosyltransferase
MAGWKLKVASNSRLLHKESASTGSKSPNFYKKFNQSSVLFFRKHSTRPLVPILRGGINRILRRLLRYEFVNALAVYRGIRSGLIFVSPDEN